MTTLLTLSQAAELLQCHERTIRRAIERRELRAHLVGRSRGWRIREADLDEWLEARANRPADTPPTDVAGRPPRPRAVAAARGRRPRRAVGHLNLADLDSPKAGA